MSFIEDYKDYNKRSLFFSCLLDQLSKFLLFGKGLQYLNDQGNVIMFPSDVFFLCNDMSTFLSAALSY